MIANEIEVDNQLTLKWGDYSRLSMWAHCKSQVSLKVKQGIRKVFVKVREGDLMREAEVKILQLLICR